MTEDFDPRFTGIFHPDFDCPAMATWADSAPFGVDLFEFDPATGEVLARWTQSSMAKTATWRPEQLYSRQHFTLSAWRSCLRCGSVPAAPIATCPQCFLTACDCND